MGRIWRSRASKVCWLSACCLSEAAFLGRGHVLRPQRIELIHVLLEAVEGLFQVFSCWIRVDSRVNRAPNR